MGRRCHFVVEGTPVPWKRPVQGRNIHTGAPLRFNDKRSEAQRKLIVQAARRAWPGPPATGPVIVRTVAVFAIPKSWPAQTQALAREAQVLHVADPDLDRLSNLVHDALSGVAYMDDNQVCGHPNSAKRYGEPERTEITIEEIDQPTEAHKTPGQRRLEREIAELGLDAVLARMAGWGNRSKTKRHSR